jgi:hypothetical protein
MPRWPNFHSAQAIWHSLAWPMLLDWAVGGVIVGFVLAAAVFVITTWWAGGENDSADASDVEIEQPAAHISSRHEPVISAER